MCFVVMLWCDNLYSMIAYVCDRDVKRSVEGVLNGFQAFASMETGYLNLLLFWAQKKKNKKKVTLTAPRPIGLV